MAEDFALDCCAVAKYTFKTSPKERHTSDVCMHVNATVAVSSKHVEMKLHHVGCHSRPFHRQAGKHMGPGPTALHFEARAIRGTIGFPRCSRAPNPGSTEVSAAHVNFRGGEGVDREDSTHTKQSCDIRCSAGLDADIAMYSISVPDWSSPTTLKKHPTVPDGEARYKQWRELYDQPLANGFCQTDIQHVFTWDRSPEHEQVEIEITLKALVGYMVCVGGWLRNKKYLWKCDVIEADVYNYIAKKAS